jgi:hypothetical protein
VTMILLAAFLSSLSMIPYIHINHEGSNLSHFSQWTLPILQAVGGFLTASMIPLVLQRRISRLTASLVELDTSETPDATIPGHSLAHRLATSISALNIALANPIRLSPFQAHRSPSPSLNHLPPMTQNNLVLQTSSPLYVHYLYDIGYNCWMRTEIHMANCLNATSHSRCSTLLSCQIRCLLISNHHHRDFPTPFGRARGGECPKSTAPRRTFGFAFGERRNQSTSKPNLPKYRVLGRQTSRFLTPSMKTTLFTKLHISE